MPLPPPLTGDEPFHTQGSPLPATVLSFWRWAHSDLLSNALRGVLAEYLVAHALGVAHGVRTEWDASDLLLPSGARIEVKSAAYLQSWKQAKPSAITFGIAPTRGWDAATNTYSTGLRRQSDGYVFALLHHADRDTVDPRDVSQWTFRVLATRELDRALPTQKTIALASLDRLGPRVVGFADLRSAVDDALHAAPAHEHP